MQLSSDQQPYLQGFIPVTSLALSIAYGFSLISYDTGAGFVTAGNLENLRGPRGRRHSLIAER